MSISVFNESHQKCRHRVHAHSICTISMLWYSSSTINGDRPYQILSRPPMVDDQMAPVFPILVLTISVLLRTSLQTCPKSINRIHAIDSIHIVQVFLDPRSTSSMSHRIHVIDSIHIVHVSSHPRYRLDSHRPGLITSTLSTRSTSSICLMIKLSSNQPTNLATNQPTNHDDTHRIHAIASIHTVHMSHDGSHRIHAIDAIHIVHVSSHPRYRRDPHRPGLPQAIDSIHIFIHAIDSIHLSSGSHRIHAIDSIHIVYVSSHPRYRRDPHHPCLIPCLIASTLSPRSTSSRSSLTLDPHRPCLIASTLSTRSTSSRSHPRYRV